MNDNKISHYKVPYTIENGSLILDDSKKEFIKEESVNLLDGIIKLSTNLAEDNNKEKDLAIGVGIEEGFIIMKYLT